MQMTETRRRSRKAPPEICSRPKCRALAGEICIAISGAAEVHRALCAPEMMRAGDFEIATRIIPARHVGGDFVCIMHRGNRMIAVVGDLMGKGLSAAMWLTHTVDLIHRAAESSHTLKSMLELLNSELVNSRVGAPLTTALAVELDTGTNVISYSSAGHPPGILLRSGSVEVLSEGGPILGAFANADFVVSQLELSPGDTLIGYSDGISEARNSQEEEFTTARIVGCLRSARGGSACSQTSNLLNAVNNFCSGCFPDDVSILAIQRV